VAGEVGDPLNFFVEFACAAEFQCALAEDILELDCDVQASVDHPQLHLPPEEFR
jgi:hypothetical protein